MEAKRRFLIFAGYAMAVCHTGAFLNLKGDTVTSLLW